MKHSEALAVIASFQAVFGRRSKSLIREAWETGGYRRLWLETWESQLQRIRNTYGPLWLIKPYSEGQVAAMQWLKIQPGLLLPHTTNPPYCHAWNEHKPATVQSFRSLIPLGLAEIRERFFWHLTPAGEQMV